MHTNNVVEVKKDYVSNKQNTDNLPPAVVNMECNESKIVNEHTNSYTMNEPANPTPFYVYCNANETLDDDACSCILNEQNTDNLPPAILTPSNLDGNVNEILEKDTSIYTTNEQNINNLATLRHTASHSASNSECNLNFSLTFRVQPQFQPNIQSAASVSASQSGCSFTFREQPQFQFMYYGMNSLQSLARYQQGRVWFRPLVHAQSDHAVSNSLQSLAYSHQRTVCYLLACT